MIVIRSLFNENFFIKHTIQLIFVYKSKYNCSILNTVHAIINKIGNCYLRIEFLYEMKVYRIKNYITI